MLRALVVGGTSGIGLAIATGFASRGWAVTAAGLEPEQCEGRATETLSFAALDVTNSQQIQTVLGSLDRIDAVINAAGIICREAEFHLPTFEQVLAVNLTGTMRVCMSAKNQLIKTGGSIVNIASMLSIFGGGNVPAYAASKGGIVQLTKSLAIAWAPQGVRVNAIAPGWIETPLTAALRDNVARDAAIRARTPLARWGRPEELVGPAWFLTSPDASFITGAVLTVDGGYSIT